MAKLVNIKRDLEEKYPRDVNRINYYEEVEEGNYGIKTAAP